MKIWVLQTRTMAGTDYMSVGGSYTTAEGAKEAAEFQMQCDAEGCVKPEWEHLIKDEGGEIIGYRIHNGMFKDCAEIWATELDELY